MKNLILFGRQGAGKGTQARILVENFGFTMFETGAELRALMQQDTPLAQKVKAIVERGDLVPNEIVMEIVEQFVKKMPTDQAILFDGIPRSMEQKQSLDALLQSHNRPIFSLFIDISPDEALKRLLLRGRSDDNQEAIRTRLQNYENETLPVIEAYEQEGILERVDGMQSIEEVAADVSTLVQHEKDSAATE